MELRYDSEYVEWLGGLKNRIKSTQIKPILRIRDCSETYFDKIDLKSAENLPQSIVILW